MEGNRMRLFGRTNKAQHLVPEAAHIEIDDNYADEPANYNTALDYLVGLSDTDYETIFKVANVYRNANKDACAVLNVKYLPTTFILAPSNEAQEIAEDAFVDEQLQEAFEDDLKEETKKTNKS